MSKENQMNTKQIAELYLGAAADFRELLRVKGTYVMAIDGASHKESQHRHYLAKDNAGWFCSDKDGISNTRISEWFAVAAMTESWRERLEEKHGVWFDCPMEERWVVSKMGEFVPMRGIGTAQVLQNGVFATAGVYKTARGQTGRDEGTVFKSLAEALCAAVKALVAEKRAAGEARKCVRDSQ